jgi:hypothetical protein
MFKRKLTEQQLFDAYIEHGSLKTVSEKTGYSFLYLKQLSAKRRWKERKRFHSVDDKNKIVEVIRCVDGKLTRVTSTDIIHTTPKSKKNLVEKWNLGEEEVVIDNTETDKEGNIIIGKSEAKFMREKIQEREKAIEAQRAKKKEVKKPSEKIPLDPIQAAIEKVMSITGADSRFRNQAEYEIRRWLARYCTIDESIERACKTVSGSNTNLKTETKKSSDDPGNVSEKMWSKLWGKVGKIRY